MSITDDCIDLTFFLLSVTSVWIPLFWLVLLFTTPDKLKNQYFKTPYFSQGEVLYMIGFPGGLFRVAIFAAAITFPNLAKKRQLNKLYEEVSGSYLYLARFFSIGVLIHGSLLILITLVMTIKIMMRI